MNILILDDDRSHGELVASVCRKLGHRVTYAPTVTAALDELFRESVDVVLLALMIEQQPGVEVVALLQENGFSLPTAFCTSTCQDTEQIAAAAALAALLPPIWTQADLKAVLDALHRESKQRAAPVPSGTIRDPFPPDFSAHQRSRVRDAEATEDMPVPPATGIEATTPGIGFAAGTDAVRRGKRAPGERVKAGLVTEHPTMEIGTALYFPDRHEQTETTHCGVAMAIGELQRTMARVYIACPDWALVRRLCADLSLGMRTVEVRVNQTLGVKDEVLVGLTLPDEMVVSVAGQVRDAEYRIGEPSLVTIELVGFGRAQLEYLLAACEAQNMSELDTSEEDSCLTMPRLPVTRDSVELEEAWFEGEPRISWSKP